MDDTGLSVADVFGLAIELEHEGIKFFLAAYESTDRPALKKLFNDLAMAEQSHERKLVHLRDKLTKAYQLDDAKDKDEVIASYLTTWVKDKVFFMSHREIDKLARSRDIRAVLCAAIDLEKDAITFFTGLREFVDGYLSDGVIKQILAEEMQHIVILKRHLNQLGGGGC